MAKMKNYNCSAEGEISYVSIWSDRRIRKMERHIEVRESFSYSCMRSIHDFTYGCRSLKGGKIMYINPFLAGAISIVLLELILFFVWGIYNTWKK